MSSLTPWANMSSSRMFALPVEMAARRRSLCCLVSFWSLRMRTESLRELASFFVRFLRKGGAIVYAAAAPCVLRPASRGGGVRSALPRRSPSLWAALRARGGLRRKLAPRSS